MLLHLGLRPYRLRSLSASVLFRVGELDESADEKRSHV